MKTTMCYFSYLLFIYVSANAHANSPFSIHDLISMQRLSDPQLSQDESRLAFVVTQVDLKTNEEYKSLWLANLNSTTQKPKQLTPKRLSIKNPQWTQADKTIFFLGKEKDSTQIWRISSKGHQLKQVTRLPVSINHFSLSPDRRYLAFSAEVYPNCGADFECTRKRDMEIKKKPNTGIVYEKLFIRHWDRWKNGKRSHLFTFKLDQHGNPTRKPVAISVTLDGDIPPKPFGGTHNFAFTADSKYLIFSARIAGKTESWSTNFDLFKASVEGSNALTNLTETNPAWDDIPVLSPNGQWLAYLAMTRPGFEADRFHLKLRNLQTGETRTLVENWDRSISNLAFTPDSNQIILSAPDKGQQPLFIVDIKQNSITPLITTGSVKTFSVGQNKIIFGLENFKMPTEFFSADFSGNHKIQITRFNQAKLQTLTMGDYESFSFAGWNNENVDGFIVKPANFSPDKQYPVVLIIHGGPQANFSNHFSYRWNPQVYAGNGYAVIMINFHGSTGYGQSFTDSISNDWGGKPFLDLKKGLESALNQYPWLDNEHIGAVGYSYGGYMINWIAGNWPGRFKCLVNHAGVINTRMMYYTTEELWFVEWDHDGPPFINPDAYEKHNPIQHIAKWRDPMLVTQGGLDFRVPETQSFATFTALQRRGIESRLLYFPDENHSIQAPLNSIQWHEEVIDWLDHYLK